MFSQRSLLRTAVCAHVIVVASAAASVLAGTSPVAVERAIALALALPLLVTIRGLAGGRRRTLQIVSLLLVLYIGLAVVEVVAARGSWLPGVWLAAAGIELGLLLIIVRRPRPRASPESEELSDAAER